MIYFYYKFLIDENMDFRLVTVKEIYSTSEKGFVFTRNGMRLPSVGLFSMMKKGRSLSDSEKAMLYALTSNYLKDASESNNNYCIDDYLSECSSKEVISYPVLDDGYVYKVLDDYGFNFLLENKTIKLGSLSHYRKSENRSIKDLREGNALVVVTRGDDSGGDLIFHMTEPDTHYIYCTTSRMPDKNYAGFGSHVIRIKNHQEFKNRVSAEISSFSAGAGSVIYKSSKVFSFSNENFFDVIWKEQKDSYVGLASEIDESVTCLEWLHNELGENLVFTKPKGFSGEKEFRFFFDMAKELMDDYLIVKIDDIWDYIEVV